MRGEEVSSLTNCSAIEELAVFLYQLYFIPPICQNMSQNAADSSKRRYCLCGILCDKVIAPGVIFVGCPLLGSFTAVPTSYNALNHGYIMI